jgi:hypothetical protein
MSKVCETLKDAEDTLEFYRSKDGTEGYIEESDGKFMVYRRTDHKVLKSIRYSAADLNSILQKEH